MEDSAVSTENKFGFSEEGYPNPFSPSGIGIDFTLGKDDTVKIEAFTSDGDSTGVYISRFFKSGDKFVNLNVDSLTSGVYLIKITTSDTTMTRKITLLK